MKRFILFSLILILSATIILAIPNPGHSAEEILITINSQIMTLQEAMDDNFLKDTIALPSTEGTTSLTKSHPADNLQIYLGERLSLQESIDKIGVTTSIANKGFCRDAPGFFNWLFNLGHDADQISFNDGETLQEKINSQQFCSYEWVYSGWGECSESCGWGTKTRVVECKRSDGKIVEDSYCSLDEAGIEPVSTNRCYLVACPTCYDGIQNQDEEDIDCGGPCQSCSIPLAYWKHTDLECIAAGGTVVDGSIGKICKFIRSSCLSGWTGAGETTTTPKTCRNLAGVGGCTTGSHNFATTAVESCSYRFKPCPSQPCYPDRTCYATVTQIGCY